MSDNTPRLSAWKQNPEDLNFEAVEQWFVGDHFNRYPLDRPISVDDILLGWIPDQKFISRDTKVLAFGSCFAEYFIKFLSQHGYNRWQLPVEKHGLSDESLLLSLGQTFENVFVIAQQLRWAFGEFTPQTALWFKKDKSYFEATEERRENIRHSFQEIDVLVVTLGLSEIWFDQAAGEPMWRAVTASLYDPSRHVFRSATVSQTLEALFEIDRLAKQFLPGKKIIFTLSPIPLLATFRNQSPITANAASKATLRAALDEFLAHPDVRLGGRFYYFPSYELAFHLFANPFGADNRHVRPEVAGTILSIFSSLYTDLPVAPLPPVEDRAAILQRRVLDLEHQLVQKEHVILELDAAARDRLAIINELSPQAAPEAQLQMPDRSFDPGLANFYNGHYRRHNDARLNHLASLGLPLTGRTVLEVGAGPGHHTGFFVERACRVVATDARIECIEQIPKLFPNVRTAAVDMNNPWRLEDLGTFEIVYCYGLLYHLENPKAAIAQMASVCSDLLLLETAVSARGNDINIVPETERDFTQSITGTGCRPGREWVFKTLQTHFPFVYETRTQPNHEEFPVDWTAVHPDQGLTRIILIASRSILDNPLLSPLLLDHQDRFEG